MVGGRKPGDSSANQRKVAGPDHGLGAGQPGRDRKSRPGQRQSSGVFERKTDPQSDRGAKTARQPRRVVAPAHFFISYRGSFHILTLDEPPDENGADGLNLCSFFVVNRSGRQNLSNGFSG